MAFRNVVEGAAFVGDAACFDCHEDLWRGYQDHGMAQSYYRLSPDNAVEDFQADPLFHEASGFYYRVYEDNGAYFQQEYRLDGEGRRTHQLDRRMDYVVGSGTAARTYLSESRGRLYELPLTWYTQVRKWDFSPGYQTQNKRFDRLIPDRCMACHNSYPEAVSFVEGKYAEVPEGIGCERCHGPGGLHVSARLSQPEVSGPVDATIVNPSHLVLDRQLDVCQQCHLNGAVTVLRTGRGMYDFRPSESLADHVALFTDEAGRSGGEVTVISHADRMQRSACFLATAGQAEAMTCVTCHNPHEGFRDRGSLYFNETCVGCHVAEGLSARFASSSSRSVHEAPSDCVACHMPKVEVKNAPHSSFTDHWIRVIGGDETALEPMPAHETPDLVAYFDRDREGREGQLYLGMAYLILGEQKEGRVALEKGITLLKEVLAEDPDHGEAQFLLGQALVREGRMAEAVSALERAVALDEGVAERLHALARAYAVSGRDPVTIEPLYRQALTIQPALAEVRISLGGWLQEQGRLDEALAEYRMAAAEKPWSVAAHYGRGTVLLRQNKTAEAAVALQEALQLDPDHTNVLVNLAAVRIVEANYQDAADLLERAVQIEPMNVAALGNLGLIYAQLGRYAEAREKLQQVVRLNPADERAREALAQITQLLKQAS